jgi:hypothetical protein
MGKQRLLTWELVCGNGAERQDGAEQKAKGDEGAKWWERRFEVETHDEDCVEGLGKLINCEAGGKGEYAVI